jgi:hypothetical protein
MNKEETKEYNKNYYASHKKYHKEYHDANKKKIKKYHKHYYADNKDAYKEYYRTTANKRLRNKYLLTFEEYQELFNKQQGKCAICGTHQDDLKSSLCVDHNHTTGKVRGLLCHKCNLLIGNANENTATLNNAMNYLCTFN